jgi:hypothetical protein
MFENGLYNSMLAWIGGVGLVQVIVEYLKRLFGCVKDKKLLGYALSIIVSFLVTVLYLYLIGSKIYPEFILYGIPLWVTSSGIYDIYHTPKSQ